MAEADGAPETSRRAELKSLMAQEDCYTVEELPDESSEDEFVEAYEEREPVTLTQLVQSSSDEESAAAAAATVGSSPGQAKPLRLLDLPVDILTQIVDRITHTRDLLPLARTHTTLHRLTIPHIYSRFEIVWPPPSTGDDPEPDIDALTHGLTTLTFAEEVLDPNARIPSESHQSFCTHCGHKSKSQPPSEASRPRKRRGNYYAQFVRHFSLSNGPLDAVREYLLTRDNGKMLGTLVALAIARMPNLKTFIWDMPTGVSRDVFTALSALDERIPNEECKLEKVWIRWHNKTTPLYIEPKSASSSPQGDAGQANNSNAIPPPPPPPPPVVVPTPGSPSSSRGRSGDARIFEHPNHVELLRHPNLSLLPSVVSLTVLDIDELAHLDEINLLISKSRHKLRKLRIGIAKHATKENWAQPSHTDNPLIWDPNQRANRDPNTKRWGGVLGTIFGPTVSSNGLNSLFESGLEAPHGLPPIVPPVDGFTLPKLPIQTGVLPRFKEDLSPASDANELLELEVLELERVPLSVFCLTTSIDWSQLTELTLFNCPKDDVLWKLLRKYLAPRNAKATDQSTEKAVDDRFWSHVRRPLAAAKARDEPDSPTEYPCKLRKVQTNRVSKALLNFLIHTLEPDTLEVLFLQNHGNAKSEVSVDDICKGPVRRHRGSLKRLMMVTGTCESYDELSWDSWMITSRDMLSFLTSGKLLHLRELGIAINWKDWHYFLQRLPMLPQLRSIYVPYMQDRASRDGEDARQLAMHILDIVTLRPDIKLAYLGIFDHCYDIREGRANEKDVQETTPAIVDEAEAGEEQQEDSLDEDEDDNNNDSNSGSSDEELSHDDSSEVDEDLSFPPDADEEDGTMSGPHFKLREIVWYERKVQLFRARHARIRGWRASDKNKQEFET